MKRIFIIAVILTLFGCKETPEETKEKTDAKVVDAMIVGTPVAAINRIFVAHGGLENWKKKRTLSFTLSKPEAPEVHTTDLYSRKEKIEMPEVAMGYDGQYFWLADAKENYTGDPIFYHNLMFYFYAMPFVLGDNGIVYSETEELVFEEKTYPGIRISFDEGVGTSSKDEYFLHYDPETYQMVWLGYTVTYRSGEKSDNVRWIRYDDWMKVDDLILPKSITWHVYEGRSIKEAKNTVSFENVELLNTEKADGFYAKPKNAKVVTKP